MAISETFEQQFNDENKMPDIFYEWLKVCPVLWIRGTVHSDYMEYKFDSSGRILDLDQLQGEPDNVVEFAEDKVKPISKKKKTTNTSKQ
jgi:hypothetical protein